MRKFCGEVRVGISNKPVEGPELRKLLADEEEGGASKRARSSSLSFSWSDFATPKSAVREAAAGWSLRAVAETLNRLLRRLRSGVLGPLSGVKVERREEERASGKAVRLIDCPEDRVIDAVALLASLDDDDAMTLGLYCLGLSLSACDGGEVRQDAAQLLSRISVQPAKLLRNFSVERFAVITRTCEAEAELGFKICRQVAGIGRSRLPDVEILRSDCLPSSPPSTQQRSYQQGRTYTEGSLWGSASGTRCTAPDADRIRACSIDGGSLAHQIARRSVHALRTNLRDRSKLR